ncbi:tRNA (adenosine(37)-N6)-dimethylallyltransferase MiaA [Parvularcula dongshanensis]|uniref:tRNA dimethylallyltransferase n=1 Tax=Parvularcula dongshanensis TaxID=1173995 RepID=A0A840I2Z0_9PROT|nr:tRNA (adenosine(37)-N6)-dimethylallyltransferase MiaA [Parvularcula dongshanensis]MBB4659209.1 tRNA dimethylallyltransferase [Parvularcula dongshanensis]
MTPLLILAGPTASGKSAAAIRLAREVGGEVVNADAMQVYSDLRIVTARPSAEDEAAVPHHLYGHVDGAERYSVGRYLREAGAVIREVRGRGRVPVVTGGTGLYLLALTRGLAEVPPVPEEVTAGCLESWRADPVRFRAALMEVDPAAAVLEPADRQRHVRTMAVWRATGRTLSDWQKEERAGAVPGPHRAMVLCPPREVLYERIERRWDEMMAAGGRDEVAALLDRDLPPDLPVMKALGVPQIAAVLRGESTEAEATESAKRETRRFAKRQMTWFRGQTDWPWAETFDTTLLR